MGQIGEKRRIVIIPRPQEIPQNPEPKQVPIEPIKEPEKTLCNDNLVE